MSSCEPGRRCCDVPAFRMSRECQSNDVAAKLEVATSLGLLEGGLGIYLIGGVLVKTCSSTIANYSTSHFVKLSNIRRQNKRICSDSIFASTRLDRGRARSMDVLRLLEVVFSAVDGRARRADDFGELRGAPLDAPRLPVEHIGGR